MTARILTANVITQDPRRPRVEAVGIRDGRLVAVGTIGEVVGALPAADRVDFPRASILPGFIDAHHHFSLAALDRRGPAMALPRGHDRDTLLHSVAEYVAVHEGRWLRVHGYDPGALGAPVSRAELDAVCPDRPLLLLASTYHEAVANSAALTLLDMDSSSGMLVEQQAFVAEARARDAVLATYVGGTLAAGQEPPVSAS